MSATTEGLRTGRRVTGLQAGLGAVIAVVLLGLAWFLFLRGGPEAAEAPAATVAPATEPAETGGGTDQAAKPPQKNDEGPVETDKLFAPKDPFEPLVDPAGDTDTTAADTTGTDTTGTDTTGTDTTGGEGDGVTETGIPGANDDGGGSGGGDVAGFRVELLDVDKRGREPSATVSVNGTSYDVSEKEVFAEHFKVLNIYGQCSSMLFGDVQFTLCKGQQILK